MSRSAASVVSALVCLLALGGGCNRAYYGFWETLGKEKRDLLVDRVEDARDAQEDAKEQIQTTLQRFQEVTGFEGGDLEDQYNTLNSAYESARGRAAAVTEEIDAVEAVAEDLFSEWEEELEQYSNAELRASSRDKLRQTRTRYEEFLGAMRRAEAKMEPVLTVFGDQVLYLKHNLNAQAIASLETTTSRIEDEVAVLIRDMEASIAEANEFISQMQ